MVFPFICGKITHFRRHFYRCILSYGLRGPQVITEMIFSVKQYFFLPCSCVKQILLGTFGTDGYIALPFFSNIYFPSESSVQETFSCQPRRDSWYLDLYSLVTKFGSLIYRAVRRKIVLSREDWQLTFWQKLKCCLLPEIELNVFMIP